MAEVNWTEFINFYPADTDGGDHAPGEMQLLDSDHAMR